MEKIALCSDHAGFELKSIVMGYLESQNIEYIDYGTFTAASCDYADFAHPAAKAVEDGICTRGIGICGSGNGIAMTLNHHRGIRAAICWLPELAALARQHNDANFLVLPARFIEPTVALEDVDIFFKTAFEGGRHERRIAKIPVD